MGEEEIASYTLSRNVPYEFRKLARKSRSLKKFERSEGIIE